MERKERLRAAYDYLRGEGYAHTQADVADRMKATRPNISSAFNGDAKCLTDKFLIRFNRAYNNVFNDDWLLTGEGEMLRTSVVQHGDNNNNQQGDGNVYNNSDAAYNTLLRIVEAHQKTTDGFQRSIEKFQEQLDRLITLLEKK